MISFLLESAARSLALGIVVGIVLWVFRIRSIEVRLLAWTSVLFAALVMPALAPLMEVVMTSGSPAVAWIPAASVLFLPPLSSATPAASFSSALDWTVPASAIYALLAAALLFRLFIGFLRGQRLRREATPVNELWTRGWDVRSSDTLTIPVTFLSTILLPSSWKQWNAFTQEAVLLHERSHVRRRDFYIHLSAGVYQALFWFSPLAWWLRKELLYLAEAASDDDAVRQLKDRISYAEALFAFAKRGTRHGFMAVAMARGRTVGRRVARMLGDSPIAAPISMFARVLLLAAVAPLVVLAGGAGFVQTVAAVQPALLLPVPAPPQTSPTRQGDPVSTRAPRPVLRAPQAAETQYLAGWEESEVPDIIAPEERNTFLGLQNDEERKQFIEQFWLRRDPTPGTVDNEYRDEYYRRVALANNRFTIPGALGWRTDRGRILIKHGEPDEIETHAQGDVTPAGDRTPPFERWRYRFIEGVGRNVILEFVDTSRDGNYRLSSGPGAGAQTPAR